MTYTQFYNQWHSFACFSTMQVAAIYPTFNRSNFLQWQKAGYIISLRRGWYAFADYLSQPDYAAFFAGKIYSPSYISLHYALAFYEIIPEAVVQITSVTTQKTAEFQNPFAHYSYQTIRPDLFWGYEPKTMLDGKTYMMATPEKAILDLLYLYPQYNSPQEMLELRLDEDFMHSLLNKDRLSSFLIRANKPILTQRVNTLLSTYAL